MIQRHIANPGPETQPRAGTVSAQRIDAPRRPARKQLLNPPTQSLSPMPGPNRGPWSQSAVAPDGIELIPKKTAIWTFDLRRDL
jgi:hypothetical protein